MRIEVLTDAALDRLEPAKLMELIAGVQRLIDTVAYQRWLIATADARQAARSAGDACVADSLVRVTGMARAARRASPRHARTAPHVTPRIYDDLVNIKKCPTGFASCERNRCHTPCLGLSHAN